MKKLKFNGKLLEFVGVNILLSIITLMTFGLGSIFQLYWNIQYVVNNTTIE